MFPKAQAVPNYANFKFCDITFNNTYTNLIDI